MIETALEWIVACAIGAVIALGIVGGILSLMYKCNAFRVPL